MASKKNRAAKSAGATPEKAKSKPKEKGPSLHERVLELEARLLGLEHRLGIDHAAIAADAQASAEAGAAAAPLSEPPVAETDGEA